MTLVSYYVMQHSYYELPIPEGEENNWIDAFGGSTIHENESRVWLKVARERNPQYLWRVIAILKEVMEW